MEQTKKTYGILFLLASSIAFAFMGAFVRLSGDLPTFQKVFFRNLFSCIIFLPYIIKNRSTWPVIRNHHKHLFLRALVGTLGIICNFYAIDRLNLADAGILSKLAPIFAIVASAVLLKEKVSFWDTITIAVAFCGVILVVKPRFDMAILPMLVAILGAFCSGLAYTFVRILRNHGVDGGIIIGFFSTVSGLAVLPLFLMNYKAMTMSQILFLSMAGISAMLAQICLTKAYGFAPAKEIAVFDYIQVIVSALLGYYLFFQMPDIYSMLGYVIIIGAGIWRWHISMRK